MTQVHAPAALVTGTNSELLGSQPSALKGQMAETVDFRPKAGTSVQATVRNRTVPRPAP